MRNSIWSVPGYVDEDHVDEDHLEVVEARPQKLLHEAFLKIPGATWQAKLRHCASCKCCTRHQTFRPRDLVQWRELDEESDALIKLFYVKTCECDCRHMARFICRQVDANGSMPPCPRSSPTLYEEAA